MSCLHIAVQSAVSNCRRSAKPQSTSDLGLVDELAVKGAGVLIQGIRDQGV